MFTIRNVGGASLLLFGSTYLWLTPAFVAPGHDSGGALWGITLVLALTALFGFTVATWGLFRNADWWERLATASAVVGLVVLLPYEIAARQAGEPAPEFNVLIHLLGAAGVLTLLRTKKLERWVAGHVAAGH